MSAATTSGECTQSAIASEGITSSESSVSLTNHSSGGSKGDEDEEEEEEEEDDDDFIGEDELDDESTLIEAEEEGRGRDKSSAEELASLQEENEMSIEQLRAMYSNMGDMSDSDGDVDEGDQEEGEKTPKAVTFSDCSVVTLSSSSPSSASASASTMMQVESPKSGEDEKEGQESLDVDGAMKRLERADLQARSIHVSILSGNISVNNISGQPWALTLSYTHSYRYIDIQRCRICFIL